MSDAFKFVSLDEIRSLRSPIVCVITDDVVQELADDCGIRLTDDELQQFDAAFHDRTSVLHLDNVIEKCRKLAKQQKATDRRITELAAKGKTDAEIAKVLMLSEPHVVSRRQTLQALAVAT